MKKLFALLLCTALVLVCFAGCSNTPADTTAAPSGNTTAAPAGDTTAKPAADTTAAPAADTTAAPAADTTVAGTSDPNAMYEDEMQLFTERDNGDHTPVSAANGIELACKFTVASGDLLTGVRIESMPAWSTNGVSGFTFELYKWSEDYDTTLLAEPVLSAVYTEWSDNAECSVDFYELMGDGFTGLEAGSYMWLVRGDTDNIGIWAMDCSDDCLYFENGIESITSGYQAYAIILTSK